MSELIPITVAHGDGIGPEIMEAVLYILKEAEAPIRIETIEVGEKLYKKKYTSGIAGDTWESVERTRVLLKAPITTPQGGGYKSLNVTLRKALGLYANVRPAISYHPFVTTKHPELDVVVIRENEEDIYAGIEYRQTHNMYESLKLISDIGSEKIARYAFEYAVKNNRKKVSCFSKDNIMKFSDGVFHRAFDRVAKEYPQIEADHHIIDIATAKLANNPSMFDVIVTSNLYGDIISDVAAEISGSVGLAGSANIGAHYAMFEAIHGSAPDIAGKAIANPSGLLNAAIQMLIHIGCPETATLIENAWKKTIEDGVHTADIYREGNSKKKVSTFEFAKAVVERLEEQPQEFKVANYQTKEKDSEARIYEIDHSEDKTLVGVDVFFDANVASAHELAAKLSAYDLPLTLHTIAVKGLKLWPREQEFKTLSDHWCCRFMAEDGESIVKHSKIGSLLKKLAKEKMDFIKIENLYNFTKDGKTQRGYSLAQGE